MSHPPFPTATIQSYDTGSTFFHSNNPVLRYRIHLFPQQQSNLTIQDPLFPTATIQSYDTGSTATIQSYDTGSTFFFTATIQSYNTGSTATIQSYNTGSTATIQSLRYRIHFFPQQQSSLTIQDPQQQSSLTIQDPQQQSSLTIQDPQQQSSLMIQDQLFPTATIQFYDTDLSERPQVKHRHPMGMDSTYTLTAVSTPSRWTTWPLLSPPQLRRPFWTPLQSSGNAQPLTTTAGMVGR